MMKIIGNIQKYEIKAVELERVKSEKASTLQAGNSEREAPDASAVPVPADAAPVQGNAGTGA